MEILTFVLTKPSVSETVVNVPPAIWVPILVAVIVGVFGFFNARWAADRAGANSDAALQRTIKADREVRILERRMTLYADLLTYVAQRRQYQDSLTPKLQIAGTTTPQAYEPTQRFEMLGRVRALASEEVVDAFLKSNYADDAVIALYLAYDFARTQNVADMQAIRTSSDIAQGKSMDADDDLSETIRKELHGTNWSQPSPAG